MKVWLAWQHVKWEGSYLLGVCDTQTLADELCARERNRSSLSDAWYDAVEWTVESEESDTTGVWCCTACEVGS